MVVNRDAASFFLPARERGEVSPSSATEGSGIMRHDPSVRCADTSPCRRMGRKGTGA